MDILELNGVEYQSVFSKPTVIFNSVGFNQLNAGKCENVKYLVFRDEKIRFGIIAGIKNDELKSPFSAPYGGFSSLNEHTRVIHYDEAIQALNNYAHLMGLKTITITLPPDFYQPTHNAKQISSLINNGFHIAWIDINQFYRLSNFSNYLNSLSTESRRNLKIGFKNQLTFSLCETEESKLQAYQVIRANYIKKSYPLRLSFEDLNQTSQVIPSSYFIIMYQLTPIAAAIVFSINQSISQVIYWGHLPEYDQLRPMNFLAYFLFDHYHRQGKEILDIGPSSLEGKVNYGLADFKENIGCVYSLKYSFRNNYSG